LTARKTHGLKVRSPAARRRLRARAQLSLGEIDGHLGYFVRRFQLWIFQDFIRTLASVDIRPAQFSILALVEANPGRSQAEIGETLGIERARVVRLIDELQRRDLVQRVASTRDRRSHTLFLTPAGAKALTRIKTLADRHEARVVEKIGVAGYNAMQALLKKVDWD
jgi:DNA-binding MarR family transcriptional regulator